MTNLFATQSVWPPALNYHHQLTIPEVNDLWESLETDPLKADFGGTVTIRRPRSDSLLCHLFNVPIRAEERSQNMTRKIYWDITDSNPYPMRPHIFWLKPEIFNNDVSTSQLCRLLLRWLQDIPRCKTASTELFAGDACCSRELLKVFYL